jgi:hypothetical protein
VGSKVGAQRFGYRDMPRVAGADIALVWVGVEVVEPVVGSGRRARKCRGSGEQRAGRSRRRMVTGWGWRRPAG